LAERNIRAVILAGSRNDGPLCEESSEAYEALIDLWGRPMLAYILDAVAESQMLRDPIVVGFESFGEALDLDGVTLVPAGESFVESITRGVDAAGEADYLFFITGDVPLVTGPILDRFVRACMDTGGEFFAPAVTRGASEERFPEVQRTYARLREGELTLGNCFLGTRDCIVSLLPVLEDLYVIRKSVLRMAWTVGPIFLLKLALGRAGIADAERAFARVTGSVGHAILDADPEIALDVDKPSHLRAVRAMR